MAWTYLVAAGMVEIVMAIALKYTEGWTRLWPGVLGVAAGLASIVLLAVALRTLPVGTAYAIWTGIGAVGVTLVGILAFGESASLDRLVCIALIFTGIAGLKMTTHT